MKKLYLFLLLIVLLAFCNPLFAAAPTISSFAPATGSIGSSVIITGTGFTTTIANNTVKFGTITAKVTAATTTQLTVIVPVGAATQTISVTVSALTATSAASFVAYSAPTITSFSPASGVTGSNITINGNNFDATATNNIVFFGSVKATVNAATTTQLNVTVPAGASYQRISVVNISNSLSAYSADPFLVTYPGKSTISNTDFDPVVTLPEAGSGPNQIITADMNGDGLADMIVANVTKKTITVFYNKGNSDGYSTIYSATPDYTLTFTASGTIGAVVGDIDGDGKPDLVVYMTASSNVFYVYSTVANGGYINGSSTITNTVATTFFVNGLTLADIDGDGKPDILVTGSNNTTLNYVEVFRNTTVAGSASTFAAKVDLNNGTYKPYSIITADIDGDGKPDIITCNRIATAGNGAISVLLNTSTPGSISAATGVDFSTGSGTTTPYNLVAGDLDGDAKADIAVVNNIGSSVSVFHNNSTTGAVAFDTRLDLAGDASPYGIAIGDINGDGKPDLVVGNGTSASLVSIFTNTSTSGTLSFTPKVDLTSGGSSPQNLAIQDIDGDGRPDILVPNAIGSVSIFHNNPRVPIVTTSAGNTTFYATSGAASPVVIDNGLTVSETGGSTLSSATVSITSGFVSTQDVLAFTNDGTTMGNITGSYDNTNGILTLTSVGATATLAQFQAALRSVTYSDNNTTPVLANRTISFALNDGSQTGPSGTKTVVLVSANANLSALSLSPGTLSPVFDSGTLNYTATVGHDVTALTVTPTGAVAVSTIKVNGVTTASGSASVSIPLNVGANTITTLVTAADGTTTATYTVIVTRLSNDATLSALALSSGTLSPLFAPGTVSYTAPVANNVSSITVTPVTNQADAVVTVNGNTVTSGSASGNIPLNVGANTITTLVTAQDGTTITYTVVVTRLSNDATLSNFTLSEGVLSPAFAANTLAYTATVDNSVTNISVSPVTNDANATVAVNGSDVHSGNASGAIALAVGDNTITTIVTAQDGTTNTYTVVVTRLPSSNANLAGIALSSGSLSPAFDAGITSYTATVSNNIRSITINPTVADTTAAITVNGTSVNNGSNSGDIALNVGTNTINIAVTAQDGVTKINYTVTVTRLASSNADLADLAISSGTLTPAFSASVTSYSAGETFATTAITITPAVADSTATVTVNGIAVTSGSASSAIALSNGSNNISVVVTAQDGSTKTYALNIVKSVFSNNADLSSLVLSAGALTPPFSGSITDGYTVSVANLVSSVTVNPTAADANATITVNGTGIISGNQSAPIALSVGDNTITTTVNAQDGITQKVYTVTVTRAGSSNANLANLVTASGMLSPAFSSAVNSYTLAVDNNTSTINVTPTVADATASVKVNGNSVSSGSASQNISLAVGNNTINVTVTAQDGTVNNYVITATRAQSGNNILSGLMISDGTLSPVFDPQSNSYTASTTQTSITLTPTVADATATVTVNGNEVASGTASAPIPLSAGNNNINTIVTAQNGTTNTYALVITRQLLTPTITFPALNAVNYGSANVPLTATSTNTATAITYSSNNSGVATITADGNIHIVGAGFATITASQSGDANYNAAIPVSQGLTVNMVPLTISAVSQTKVYGSANPNLTVTYSGFVNGDTEAGLSAQPAITTTATTSSPVGSYPITPNGAVSANYSISYTAGNLTVTQAALNISADNQTKTYGSANPTLTLSYSGFVNGDTQASLTTPANVTTNATTSSTVGTYPILVSGAASANYSISYTAGTLNIGQAALTITAVNQTKVYGSANPTLTLSFSGFVNGDAQSSLTVQPNISTTATTSSAPGAYPITVGNAASPNYSITYVQGTLTISSFTRILTFNPFPAKTYGDADFAPVATVNSGDAVTYTTSDNNIATIVNGKIHIVTAGTVTVYASVAPRANYGDVATVGQQLIINRAGQVIVFNQIPIQQKGASPLNLNLTSSTGLPVTLSSSDIFTATINPQNQAINILGIGTSTITATQAGNINYLPVTESHVLTVQDDAQDLVFVRPGFSPNNDGINDAMVIEGIQQYPDNDITIVDRNGVKYFHASGYDNVNNVFDGHSNTGTMLRPGTYFYVLNYKANGENRRKAGYIIIKY